MKRSLPLLLLALGACTTATDRPYSPVAAMQYAAIGGDPFWMLAIGDDKIVLSTGPGPGEAGNALRTQTYRRVLPRQTGAVRRWESGEGTDVITIEASPGPCALRDQTFEDRVTVSLSGRQLQGCGGRRVTR